MSLAAVTPEIVTIEQARKYLREVGLEADGNTDSLQAIINGATGWFYAWADRRRLLDDDSSIVEYHDGDNTSEIVVNEWPITSLTSVVLYPYDATISTTLTGPGAAAYNSEMLVSANEALITLRNYLTPEVKMGVSVTYKAGYATASPEIGAIRAVLLELVMQKWQRFKTKDIHVASRSGENTQITFKSDEDIDSAVVRQLRQFRRMH